MTPGFPAIEDFRGDCGALSALMKKVWSSNTEQSLDYSAAYLESCLAAPDAGPRLAPAVYGETGEPLAFAAGFPRRVRWNGQELRLLLLTFLTSDGSVRGLGSAVWAELQRRARDAGFDGTVWYCVDGNRSNRLTNAAVERMGYHPQRLMSVPYLMRFLRPNQPPGLCPPAASGDLVRASAGISAPLARVWNEREAQGHLSRPGSVSAVWNREGRLGVLAGYVLSVDDADRTPCLFLDDVLWSDLPPDTRVEFLRDYLATAAAQARLAVVPQLGYAAPEAFAACGFRRSTRLLHAYAVLWRGRPSPVDAIYLDVF